MGRPTSKQANIEELKKIQVSDPLLDLRPLIAYVMHHSGCTYVEIGEVLDISRQGAEYLVSKKTAKLEA